ncbi:MAG TPA: pyridoxal phosphate-dependent aminotransferase [Terriglobia bacterium]|nr:pyridoxal phosphate-dependent aminotransferase [Terriglobia bacterium]
MMKLASRISRISVSQTMAVSEKSIALREQGVDVIDFGAGEPDFPTPENIKQAAIRAIQADFTKYTAIGGIKDLRKAIVEKHARDLGSRFELAECIVNVGGKHSIFNIVSATVDEGEDVVIPTPYWVSFADIARYAGANIVFAHTREDEGFRLTADLVQRSITPKTRLIIANSPCNPSGAVIDDGEFLKIATICRERGIYLLTDECYAFFLYDGRKPFSIASHPEFKQTVIVSGSLSKTYAMTGWRIGFTLADKEIISAIQKLQSHSTSNPTSIAQKAALEAISGPQESVSQMLAEYARRRKFVVERLRAIPGVQCAEPGGAFYAYPNISTSFKRGIKDSMDFSVKLLEKAHVAVVPGEAFGTTDHIRISYATSMELLDKGIARIADFMRGLA